jgi:AcrR family transcriptional regulator
VHHLYQMMPIIHVMRHSEEDKRRSHGRIVEAAARRIREAGTDGPGVAEIMADAGMTHGGFYRHFGSRDELIAEAAEHVGALIISRAVDDPQLADEVLGASRDVLLAAAG